MIIGSHKRISNIQNESEIKKIGNKETNRTKSIKSLGIIIDEHFTWKEQIDSISTKASRAIGIIRRAIQSALETPEILGRQFFLPSECRPKNDNS